jgi:hypothetical protein
MSILFFTRSVRTKNHFQRTPFFVLLVLLCRVLISLLELSSQSLLGLRSSASGSSSLRSQACAALGSSDHPRRCVRPLPPDLAGTLWMSTYLCLPPLASYFGAASETSPYSIHILQSPHAYLYYNVVYPHSYTQFIAFHRTTLELSNSRMRTGMGFIHPLWNCRMCLSCANSHRHHVLLEC